MREAGGTLAPVPWRPVLSIGGGVTLLLLAVSTRYGWHRDELYFLEAGRHHLAWGYIDQPPFTPFVARVAHAIAPGNLAVLRLLPAISGGVSVLLAALVAREFGAKRAGQVTAAAAMAASGFALGVSHLLATAAFDFTAWMALLWCAARLLRRGDPRWWTAFGAIAGVALLNKSLLPLLVGSLLVGMVIERRWDLLWSPWLVGGGGLALLLAAPNLLWQADHGWPQQDMARVLSDRLAGENRTTLFPLQLLFAGPLLVPVLWAGVRALQGGDSAPRQRALLWAWLVGLVACFVTAGRPYYVLPLTMVVLVAGCVRWVGEGRTRRLVRLLVPSAVMAALLALPILPLATVSSIGTINEAVAETVGWPELVDQIAAVVDRLPAEQRDHLVLLTGTYGEAGAIDRFGPTRGLPRAYSGHNAYADFGRPDDPAATVVAVRMSAEQLGRWFDRCTVVERVDNGLDVPNEVQGVPIVVCTGLHAPWATVWADLRHLS